ncbi:homoserine dehydrogenase [Arenicella xantha]|uniref:Homoserine dehydrogenase n=1 Tax=Arenicella xantha TaxID=644221 RepID=A0A395JP63_9GAMM|nr:homoserine dehydrogenase [Arenicella xantha]RBP51364.1 homoserine dehydrogenase [Arenicella xantha]
MKSIKVGILGLGTVGGGTANVLQRNADEISRRAGRNIEVIMASVRDLARPRLCDCSSLTLTTDPFEVVNNPDVDIVVELIGGETLAKELMLLAIDNGKHVVTANKALIALHGNEIFAAAQEQGVSVLFESAVAGGISIIKSIREGLAGNRIELVAGIINGTGNFILTEMRDKGRPFEDVLAEAQALGYAEADPTFDVEGIDAAHKLTILASIAFGIPLQFDKVYTEGITDLSLTDVDYAEQLGYRIKHLGVAKASKDGIEMRVHPTLIPAKRLIANVDGVMNAVMVRGDAVGNTLHYGAGAGAEPTASAVVADIVDVARTITADPHNRVPHLAFQPDALIDLPVKSQDAFECAFYLRFEVNDVAGVMSQLSAQFADQNISIEAITQKEPKVDEDFVSVIFITQRTTEGRVNRAIKQIESMADVRKKAIKIRVEHLN